jgi:Na+-driven multidrug efflux pump
MIMVSSAVLGAACGTGVALIFAMTIVVYRYYAAKRKYKEWDVLEKSERKNILRQINIQVSY